MQPGISYKEILISHYLNLAPEYFHYIKHKKDESNENI